jgi:hypothetical protein
MPRLESTNRIPSPVTSPAPRLWIKPMSELKASLAAVAATQIHAFPDEEKDMDMMDMACNSSPLDEGQAHVLENGTSGPPLDNGSSFKARLRIRICINTLSFEFRDPDQRVKRSIYLFQCCGSMTF